MNLDKFLWILWWVLTIIVIIGTTVLYISIQTKEIQVTLTKGEKINTEIFRFLPDDISIKLAFKRNHKLRPELGNWERLDNSSEWKNPGEPITFSIKGQNKKVTYKTHPVTETGTTLNRRLTVLNKNDERYRLELGNNEIEITVLEVGKLIAGETVTLIINPPVGLKSLSPNHFFLGYFFLTPIYAIILLIILVILIVRKRQQK